MDCGISRTLVHARRALALARIDSKYHAVQEQRDVGRAYLVDKPLRVFGAGEFLLKVRKAKARVDALAEDSAQVLFAFHDGHPRPCLVSGKRGCHAGRSAADNDHVEGLRRHGARGSNLGVVPSVQLDIRRHPSAPPSKVPQRATSQWLPAALRWDRSSARGQVSPPRGSGKSHFGSGPCPRGSGA